MTKKKEKRIFSLKTYRIKSNRPLLKGTRKTDKIPTYVLLPFKL